MGENRIKKHPILDVKKNKKYISFTFNGKKLTAKPNEMISSALFAHGIHIFGYHQKDKSPQGMFCANGQCSQCLVIADGVPVKSCITPVKEGMKVKSVNGLPSLLKDDKNINTGGKTPTYNTPVLIIGGGPAGMTAALELAKNNVKSIICDDKQVLGGKLSLQTHIFFGSIKDCYAGTRGIEIGEILSKKIKNEKKIKVWTNSPVVGVFTDKKIGIVKNGRYVLVKPKRVIISTGAREKTLAFTGCDLPGVYGAGAFQTLVNRDLIKPTDKLFIVGGGNVGLIAAYHALQAGIDVLGIVEALPKCGGYKVHLDKIKRLGVPVYTSHTVLRAEGKNHLEKVTISEIDKNFKPIKGTEAKFKADTLLIAVGLTPVDELKKQADNVGITNYTAGDAEIISEASAAMFSGKILAKKILKDMGHTIKISPESKKMMEILRGKPGKIKKIKPIPKNKEIYPVIRCDQEIPCNPCTEVCPFNSIKIKENNIMGTPFFQGKCIGCLKCISICPGLAITLVDKTYDKTKKTAKVIIPWEMPKNTISKDKKVITTGFQGEKIGKGKVIEIKKSKWDKKRKFVSLEVPYDEVDRVAGIKIKETLSKKTAKTTNKVSNEEIIICRCERVTKKEIIDYIKKTNTRDINAIKAALRVGMGPCGGKTCTEHIIKIFKELGIEIKNVKEPVERPFNQEIPIKAFLKEKEKR